MLKTFNIEDSPSFDALAESDARELDCLSLALNGTFVANGLGVSAQGSPNMSVQIASGAAQFARVKWAIPALASLTVAAASATDRVDMVVVGTPTTLTSSLTTGGGPYTSVPVQALDVVIPSGATLVFANGDTATTSAQASLGATSISVNAYTPSSNANTAATQVTGFWVVEGTPCGTAGWTKTSSGNPPVMPVIAIGSCSLGAVYVASSTTSIGSTNLRDLTTFSVFSGNVDAGGNNISDVGQLLIGESMPSGAATLLEMADSTTYASTVEYAQLHLTGSPTFSSALSARSGRIVLDGTLTQNATSLAFFASLYDTTTFAGSHNPSVISNIYLNSVFSGTATLNEWSTLNNDFTTGTGTTITYEYGFVDEPNISTGSTVTNLVGVRHVPGIASGSTVTTHWGFASDSGNNYFDGLTIFGAGGVGPAGDGAGGFPGLTGTPLAVVDIQGTGTGVTNNLQFTIRDNSSRTYSGSAGFYQWLANGSMTITADQGKSLTGILGLNPTVTLSMASGGSGVFCSVIDARPTFNGVGTSSNTYVGLLLEPTYVMTGTLSGLSGYGVLVAPKLSSSSSTWTQYTCLSVGLGGHSGTLTTVVGLDIGVTNPLAGSIVWGMTVGNYQSYHQGPLTIGSSGPPTWDLHVQGGNNAKSGVGIDVSTVGPTAPNSNASAVISVYKGTTNYYLLVTFNDGGTTRYRYMELNGTTATWTEGTSLPT